MASNMGHLWHVMSLRLGVLYFKALKFHSLASWDARPLQTSPNLGAQDSPEMLTVDFQVRRVPPVRLRSNTTKTKASPISAEMSARKPAKPCTCLQVFVAKAAWQKRTHNTAASRQEISKIDKGKLHRVVAPLPQTVSPHVNQMRFPWLHSAILSQGFHNLKNEKFYPRMAHAQDRASSSA